MDSQERKMAMPPFIGCFQFIGIEEACGPSWKAMLSEVLINLYHHTSPIIIIEGG